ncbi:outer membrane protein TolC [Hydrogenispora ethanolica]|uniref:Outer membrane protein TolC n=1 Tax=Hydrogenispora ethanolica TaxID=1082276 RepID=A0A4R1R023_HYDET|nr:TolC family protein [Hydrogenispora ethanolica]TCL58620.1 outer membrane protein TolC [Hydrogenispora ethanolica]
MKVKARQWPMVAGLAVAIAILGLGPVCLAESKPAQNLTVDQAVQIAMANSLQRQLAQGDVRTARAKAGQAASAYGPQVTLSGAYNHLNDPPDIVTVGRGLAQLNNSLKQIFAKSDSSYYQYIASQMSEEELPDDGLNYYGLQIHLAQPLYTGNKLTAANKQAQANESNARANLAAAENGLVMEVKKAYYTVLFTQRLEVTMEEAVASMEHHLAEANSYYKAGMVPKLDVMRAEVKLADLKQKQLLAQNNLNLARSAFNFVLGVDLSTVYVLNDQMSSAPLPQDLSSCQARALQNRPELAAAHAKVEMARQAVAIAKSGKKPTVALVVDGHKIEPNNEAPSLTVGVVATMKLYDHGLVDQQVAEAESVLQQANTGRELLERGVKLEVEQAYRNAEAALAAIQVAEKSLAQAQETLRMVEISYQAGLSTSLERIDAEVGLTQAKNNYSQALSMYNIALAQLDRAMGKGKEDSK